MIEFSKYVYAMGRGPSKGRNLTQSEAYGAMKQILDGNVDPHAVGALLMLMRYRGETPDEIAGFIQGMRARLNDWQNLEVTIDWPSYAAGRTRGLPWFLLSAKLVAQAGHSIFLHGWNSNQNMIASVQAGLSNVGIKTCTTATDAAKILARDNIVYCPLETLDLAAHATLKLRDVLGLRSAINTALRGYNPTQARVTVQGVFHPSYRELQSCAARLLNQNTMVVIKGGGGEFEVNPSKDIEVFFQMNDTQTNYIAHACIEQGQRLADASDDGADLYRLWDGAIENDFATQIVISTAAIALHACEPQLTHDLAREKTMSLWNDRHA